jgi:hypothetical protein
MDSRPIVYATGQSPKVKKQKEKNPGISFEKILILTLNLGSRT